MDTTTVTSKGQIVIPAAIRRKLDIHKGTRLSVEERGDEIVLKAITPGFIRNAAGTLGTGGRLSQALIQERNRDREREGDR